MAVAIRMKRMGRKHRPFYRICAMDRKSPRDGRALEELGTYDTSIPETDARAELKSERIDYWLGVGAQPSEKVAVLIRKYGSCGTHRERQKEALLRLREARSPSVRVERARVHSVDEVEPDRKARVTEDKALSVKKNDQIYQVASSVTDAINELHQLGDNGVVDSILVDGIDVLSAWHQVLPQVLANQSANRLLQKLLLGDTTEEVRNRFTDLLVDFIVHQAESSAILSQVPFLNVTSEDLESLGESELAIDSRFQLDSKEYRNGQDCVLRVRATMRESKSHINGNPIRGLNNKSLPLEPLRVEVDSRYGFCLPPSQLMNLPPALNEFRDFRISTRTLDDLYVVIRCYFRNECILIENKSLS